MQRYLNPPAREVAGFDFSESNDLILVWTDETVSVESKVKTVDVLPGAGLQNLGRPRPFQVSKAEILVFLKSGRYGFALKRSAISEKLSGTLLESPSLAGTAAAGTVLSRDKTVMASLDSGGTIHLWHIPTRKYLGWLKLVGDGASVAGRPDGTFTASEAAIPYLMVEAGKRRWPLADVPAFQERYFRKDGVDLSTPPP